MKNTQILMLRAQATNVVLTLNVFVQSHFSDAIILRFLNQRKQGFKNLSKFSPCCTFWPRLFTHWLISWQVYSNGFSLSLPDI